MSVRREGADGSPRQARDRTSSRESRRKSRWDEGTAVDTFHSGRELTLPAPRRQSTGTHGRSATPVSHRRLMRRVPPATLAAMGVVLAAAASPARARAQDLVCGAGDPVIRELVFRGNRSFAGDDLADRILTTESSWMVRTFGRMGTRRCLNKDEFPDDVLRLRKFYRERGYYTAKVDTAVQPLAGGFVRVTFQITEGDRQ